MSQLHWAAQRFNAEVVEILQQLHEGEFSDADLRNLRAGAAAIVNAVNDKIDNPDQWRVAERIKPGPAERAHD